MEFICGYCNKNNQNAANYICKNCHKLNNLSLNIDYFSYFSLEAGLDINLEQLEEKYLELMKCYHPDNYVLGEKEEQEAAINNTVFLNKAYNTLKNDVEKISYLYTLLTKKDIMQEQEMLKNNSLNLLFFDYYEKLSKANTEEKQAIKKELESMYNDTILKIKKAFSEKDFNLIANNLFIKLKYIAKILERNNESDTN